MTPVPPPAPAWDEVAPPATTIGGATVITATTVIGPDTVIRSTGLPVWSARTEPLPAWTKV